MRTPQLSEDGKQVPSQRLNQAPKPIRFTPPSFRGQPQTSMSRQAFRLRQIDSGLT